MLGRPRCASSPTFRARAATYLVFLRMVSNGLQMAHEEFECFIVVSWEVPDLGGKEKAHGTRL